MRTVLHKGTFYEVCPRCGLSQIDYALKHVHFPCPVCRNGKVKPDWQHPYFCKEFPHGPAS